MSRVIKFRGFSEKQNDWVYGFLVKRDEPFLHDIVQPLGNLSYMCFGVKRGTEGQFTGLHDKNGKEIYEGDIMPVMSEYCIVEYDTEHSRYCLKMKSGRMFIPNKVSEVVGNIYENSDLINK